MRSNRLIADRAEIAGPAKFCDYGKVAEDFLHFILRMLSRQPGLASGDCSISRRTDKESLRV